MAAHDLDSAFGNPEVFRQQFDYCLIGLPVDGALLHEHGKYLPVRGRFLFNERPFAAAWFDTNGDLHASRLAGGTKTGRHPYG